VGERYEMQELIQLYLQELRGRLEQMEACLEELRRRPEALEWAQQLRAAAHRLKGSGGTYGFPQISEAAVEIEKQLDQHLESRLPLDAASFATLEANLLALEDALQVADRREPGRAATPEQTVKRAVRRVLVVDDDLDLLRMTEAHLGEARFLVRGVARAQDALEETESFGPDLLLLDIDMPGLTGLEICRRLRGQERFQSLPIVFLTARTASSDIVAGLDAGADDYLTKPIDPAELVARCRARIERHRIVRDLVHRDELTGLYNRKYLSEQLRRRLAEAHRDQGRLAIAILDIDAFKQINDQFGHPAGDRVLQGLAQHLTRNLRAGDVIARYGGDEFVILFPGLDAHRAEGVLERLREGFKRSGFAHHGRRFSVSFSGGIASGPHAAQTGEDLIARADAALYRAKSAGRDRVERA
jgi:diguanylate cyclase (GGDEF)-like protein